MLSIGADDDIGPHVERISVAALAADWVSFDGETRRVALVNANDRTGSGVNDNGPSASAFGGGVLLEDVEMNELLRLGGGAERQGSCDARLVVESSKISTVSDWFITKGPDRWLADVVREIREEAFCEGHPVFDEGLFPQLRFQFDRVVKKRLIPSEIRSPAAMKWETMYLWWFYKVLCPRRVLLQMEASPRILFPSRDEIKCRRSGPFALSATLAQ